MKSDQEGVKCSIQCLQDEQAAMKSDQEDLQQRVTHVEEQMSPVMPQINYGNLVILISNNYHLLNVC